MACQKIKKCIINDDAIEIADKICNSEIIVWVTPIYYYEMSGQMKTLIDRCNSLYARDYKFKEVYLLSVAAEDEDYVPKKATSGLQGWVECFEGVELKKTLFIGGVSAPNEIKDNKKLIEAYNLGRNI